ncbi:MAG TPA: ABC transporter permease [Candidatus Eisenbacteria bacterium]|nr:ABC transporter permease [Candidatus Eisenbacteria bacterium]
MSAGFTAIAVLWRRDLYHFVREPMRVVASVAQPLLFWILLGSGFGRGLQTAGGSYSLFFFPGMVLLVVLFACIFSTISVIEDRQQGFLRAVLAAPVPKGGVVAGKILGSATLAFLQGLIVLALAGVAGLRPGAAGLASALVALFLASYALAGLGVALAWRSETTSAFHSGMTFLLLPLWMLSGAVFPSAGLPAWLAWIERVNPMAYTLAWLRHALGTSATGDPSLVPAILVTCAFAALAHFLAAFFARSPALKS